jgi:hypothetical protein
MDLDALLDRYPFARTWALARAGGVGQDVLLADSTRQRRTAPPGGSLGLH